MNTPEAVKEALEVADEMAETFKDHFGVTLALAYRESQAALAEKEADAGVLADKVKMYLDLANSWHERAEAAEAALSAERELALTRLSFLSKAADAGEAGAK